MKTIVGSGWYLDNPETQVNSREMRLAWLDMVLSEFEPEIVLIVDNASPTKDPLTDISDSRIVHVRLPYNAGRSINTLDKFCGWSQTFLISAAVAQATDANHYIYVEQDCWFTQDSDRKVCELFAKSKKIVLGHGLNTAYPIQQSLFGMPTSKLKSFASRFASIELSDREMAPELKFVWAGSLVPLWALKLVHLTAGSTMRTAKTLIGRNDNELEFTFSTRGPILLLSNIWRTKVEQGRSRPIDWNQRPIIAQKLSCNELAKLLSIGSD